VPNALLDVEVTSDPDSHLREIGEVFRVFRLQDSGCVAYGVEVEGERWFVKTACTAPAEASLARAARFHAAVRHPAIVPLRHRLRAGERQTLVFPWVEGEVLYHATVPRTMRRTDPDCAMARFRRLPVDEVNAAITMILDAHLAVEQAGFVAVDFYDGCVMYDFDAHQVHLIDFDEYRPGPFRVDGDRMPGSTRYMAPEEWTNGATVDARTTVFNLGRAARLLLDGGDIEACWRGTDAQLEVIAKATRPDPDERYQTVVELITAWQAATVAAVPRRLVTRP
jgi:serine/threonine-protein kinase